MGSRTQQKCSKKLALFKFMFLNLEITTDHKALVFVHSLYRSTDKTSHSRLTRSLDRILLSKSSINQLAGKDMGFFNR